MSPCLHNPNPIPAKPGFSFVVSFRQKLAFMRKRTENEKIPQDWLGIMESIIPGIMIELLATGASE